MRTPLTNHRDPDHVWAIMENAKGMVAYDVGANIGQAARVLAENFMTVVSFEPHPESYEILARDCPSCVLPLNMAVSDITGDVELSITDAHIQSGQYTTGEGLHWGKEIGKVTVKSITLDDAVNASAFDPPSFVKIDTEGHEVHVLRGAQELLSTTMPEVLVEVHKKENEALVRDLLLGYDLVKMEHESLRPISEVRQNHFWIHGVPHGSA